MIEGSTTSAAPVLDAMGVSKKVRTRVIGPTPEMASQLPGLGMLPGRNRDGIVGKAQELVGMQGAGPALAAADHAACRIGGIQCPETRRGDRPFDHVGAFAAQRLAVRIALGGEGNAFGATERKKTLARASRLGIGIGIGCPDIGIGGPLADGDRSDALIGLQRVPHGRSTADDGDGEHDKNEEGGFQHEAPVERNRLG